MGSNAGGNSARIEVRERARIWCAAILIGALPARAWSAGNDIVAPELTLDAATLPASSKGAGAAADPDLTNLSLEDLLNIEVTSVSKQKQRIGDAAAAVFVISQDDIHRSGMTTIPELLRLAPGLDVAQASAGQWAVGSRGMNAVHNDNLLVLMDGRTVYQTLFSGVYWDQVDYVLADLDRIEVVRGPGATLWGANAVNGVINIVTKSAKETQGLRVDSYGGTDGNIQSVRYGGNVDNHVFYRVYGKYRSMENFPVVGDATIFDGWDSARGGFRVDAELTGEDLLTVESDVYENRGSRPEHVLSLTPPFEQDVPMISDTEEQYILGRWTHTFSEESDVSVQAYYDRLNFEEVNNNDTQQTYDIELQHRFPLAGFNEIIWGAGYRMVTDNVVPLTTGINETIFDPERRDNSWINGFVQDDVTVFPKKLHVIAGTKVEEVPYTNLEIEPSGRVAFTPDDKNTIWAGVSRAIRSPARWEEDIHTVAEVSMPAGAPAPVAALLSGNRALNSEQMTSLEAGYRTEPVKGLSLDIAGFYNFYHGMISEVQTGAPAFVPAPSPHLQVPLQTSNQGDGVDYGFEISGQWKVRENWRLQASYSFDQTLIHAPDAISIADAQWNDTAPRHQAQVHSYYDITKDIEVNASCYFVDALGYTSPAIGDYIRVDSNVVWRPAKHVEFMAGFRNIFDNEHPEFLDVQRRTTVTQVPRSFFISMALTF
ncbi:MAG TPA: TonB-dependent receptor [Phycisphaerae bacterium]|nr:TonB-dependent receptor [Phycisphaerae bacterium]